MTAMDGDIDMRQLMRTRTEARGRLLVVVADLEVDSPDSLEQQNEVLRTSLLKEDEVKLGAAVMTRINRSIVL